MGPPPNPPPPWIPEDDLLLVKSIEGGASLELLAKGAVRFSRRYTVLALRDRWRSLLYDPVISAEASARMTELERSAGNSTETNRAEKGEIEIESVRRCYYAANRKRNRTRQLNNDSLLGEAGCEFADFNHFQSPCTPPATQEGIDTGEISGYGELNTLTARRQLDFAAPLMDYPLNFSEAEHLFMEADVRETEELGLEKLSFNNYPVDMTVDQMLDAFKIKPAVALSDHLLSKDDDMPLIEADWNDICLFGSLDEVNLDETLDSDGNGIGLLDFTVDVNLDQNLDASQVIQLDAIEEQNVPMSASVLDTHLEFGEGAMDADENEIGEQCLSELLLDSTDDGNLNQILGPIEEQNVPIPESDLDSHPEFGDDVIDAYGKESDEQGICELLLLDSPDDVNEDQMPNASHVIQLDATEEQNIPISASVLDPDSELGDGKEVHEKGLSEPLLDSPAAVNEDQMPNALQEQNVPIAASVLDPHSEIPDGAIRCTLNTEDLDVPFNDDIVFPGASYGLNCQQPPIAEPLLSGEQEQLSDNDAEVPSFSDVESLILEMDLIPKDQDMYLSREVDKYQQEDAMREIIRLEQAARACMRRSMASHGAFAVLYSSHSKHYIKKPMVLLGRGTEEAAVDIDLRTEGPAYKISRRQAILAMDEDGVFHVRNLGKCPISVNGKEMLPNETLSLQSNCLIEIRTIAFIFDVHQDRVDRYLDAIARKTQDNANNA